ncbi:MAG: hypothetical protein E5X38_21225 [Mesorhizobium sp.]|uniref:hypothetical protein n=1 Tax=Mesorhizobium sp. TaxID=1871066 RepID=UPI0011FCC035|nr:hypothetical protein [Mesorhizobium sp.]TIQ85254.1 MAG: hypothetical protein E5X38_21225 [Mesorhizobium sp.]
MTAYYVRSGAGGAGTGADWANAYTTLATAFSGKAAGDVFYVSEDHAETQASAMTLTGPGTISNPAIVICVNHSGSVPPVSADLRTTASISTTGNNGMNLAGSAIYRGIIFNVGSTTGPVLAAPSGNNVTLKLINCQINLVGNGAINISIGGVTAGYLELVNTPISFGGTSGQIRCEGVLRWRDTPSALSGTIPTNLFVSFSGRGGLIECRGVDLSAAGSGKTLVGAITGSSNAKVTFEDCKLNASVTLAGTPTQQGSLFVDAWRTGSLGANYQFASVRYAGTLTEETTIVRTGGASDGTTPLAWKIVTTANSSYYLPFECQPIMIWNDTTGSSVTATIQGIWGGGAVPNDDEIWIEVEYLGDASSPQGSFVNDAKADPLAAAAGQAAGSGTWGGSTTKFALSATFTPQQKGWIACRVKCAKASTTFYIDPKVTLT